VPRRPLGALAFLLGLWLALGLLTPLAARGSSGGAPDPRLAALEEALHEGANAVRAEHHRITLERRDDLDRVARAHSADMAARGYLAHESPEGVDPVQRIEQGGVSGFTLAAENAGRTSRSQPVQEILGGWQLSPVHRRNLLAPAFNATGVGAARAPDGTLYFTQVYVTFPKAPTQRGATPPAIP
jgi:uncharacterized protein YkwD